MEEQTRNYNILLVDDDDAFCSKMGYAYDGEIVFERARTEKEATEKINASKKKNSDIPAFDLILLDLDLKGDQNYERGIDYLKKIKEEEALSTPIIVITADGRTTTTVKAMKAGAKNFLYKGKLDPVFWKRQFVEAIEELELKAIKKNYKELQTSVNKLNKANHQYHPFISSSKQIDKIKNELKIISRRSNTSVLILGETGVGKEVAARYLHSHGARKDRPFVDVNLSAIHKDTMESNLFGHRKGSFTGASDNYDGYFRQAQGGVLFLDEIGDISMAIQTKLLRFFDNKTIRPVGGTQDIELDIQIVTATNKDLAKEVREGRFKEDFYHRLRGYVITIPPLRERRDDIFKIMEYYILDSFGKKIDSILDEEVKDKLYHYKWNGNIRELRQVAETMMLKSEVLGQDKVTVECLPDEILYFVPVQDNLGIVKYDRPADIEERAYDPETGKIHFELRQIDQALKNSNGRKQDAAETLKKDADKLYYIIKKYKKTHLEILLSYPYIKKAYKL